MPGDRAGVGTERRAQLSSTQAKRRPRPGAAATAGGLAVDSHGNPAIDPTENVKALSEAANARQDDLREMHTRLMSAELRHLETLSIVRNQHTEKIAAVREKYAEQIRILESDRLDKIRQVDVLAGNTAADRALVAIQTLASTQAQAAETLRALVTSTAAAVAAQTTSAMAAITERIAALEVSRYKGEGKEAVADPMIAQLLGEMTRMREGVARNEERRATSDPAMRDLQAAVATLAAAQQASSGKGQGMSQLWGIIASAAGFLVTLIVIGTFVFVTSRQPAAQPPTIYVPSPTGTMLPSTPPAQVPR